MLLGVEAKWAINGLRRGLGLRAGLGLRLGSVPRPGVWVTPGLWIRNGLDLIEFPGYTCAGIGYAGKLRRREITSSQSNDCGDTDGPGEITASQYHYVGD